MNIMVELIHALKRPENEVRIMHATTPKEFYTERGYSWLSERKSPEMTASELSYLEKRLKKGWKVLDLACGYGRFTIPLAEMGYVMYGLDITPVFIEEARRESAKRNLDIEFTVGDMNYLPYSDSSFDAVICMWNAFGELAHVREQLRVITEIIRVMKCGGLAIVEVRNHRSSGLNSENTIDGHTAMPSYNHTRGSMKKLMSGAGISTFKAYIDDFGGRKRLILKMVKP